QKLRTAIESILGSLPRESLAVRKFRDYYKFPVRRVSRTPHDTRSGRPSHTVDDSPDSGYRRTETRDLKPESGERETESQQPRTIAHASSIDAGNNHNGLIRIRREDAPAEWFHSCAEGRQRKCVRSEFLDRVDLPIQCYSHEADKQIVASSG